MVFCKKRKEREVVCYLRLLRAKAAATAMIMTTTAPIATYVATGVGLPGGVTTGLGDAVKVGAIVGFMVEV